MRFLIHLQSGQSEKDWLLALNVSGDSYLRHLENLSRLREGEEVWLLNKDGGWLFGPPDLQWQFLLNPGDKNTLTTRLPDVANKVESVDQGSVVQEGILYTFNRLYPRNASVLTSQTNTLPFAGSDLPWTIIVRTDLDAAIGGSYFAPNRLVGLMSFAGVLLVLGLVAAFIAWKLSRKLSQEEKLKRTLSQSTERLEGLIKNAPEGVVVVDSHGNILDANDAMGEMMDVNPARLADKAIADFLRASDASEADWAALLRTGLPTGRTGMPRPVRMALLREASPALSVEALVAQVRYHESTEYILHIRDISLRLQQEEVMARMSRALEQTADSVVISNDAGVIEYVNQSFEVITGYSVDEARGRRAMELLDSHLQSGESVTDARELLFKGNSFSDIFINRRKDGKQYPEERTISPIRNEAGEITHFISTGKDITERIKAQERLHHLAHFDELTGLPNRELFRERMAQAILRAEQTTTQVGIILLDLDSFKQINDTLGHESGDQLLIAIAQRIGSALRPLDTLARLGGDEFAIIFEESDVDFLVRQAQRIHHQFTDPFDVDHHSVSATSSVGIVLYPNDGEDVKTLLKHADMAMYRAKDQGRNQYGFFTPDMTVRALEQFDLELKLRKALHHQQYELHYQPKICAQTGRMVGSEALLRWRDSGGTLHWPDRFIPTLESNGLIIEVGAWILREGCAKIAEWESSGRPAYLSVNVSARQLLGSPLHETVAAALAASGCRPAHLELELTESVLISDVSHALDMLSRLRALGVQIAMDDFGTGYSSLAYLRDLPIDTLKIDREFIRGLPDSVKDAAVARAIVELAHSINLSVVAEGVETPEQADFLRNIGVEFFQGFYFSKPLEIGQLDHWVDRPAP